MSTALHAASIPFWIAAIFWLFAGCYAPCKRLPGEVLRDLVYQAIAGLVLSTIFFAIAGVMWSA